MERYLELEDQEIQEIEVEEEEPEVIEIKEESGNEVVHFHGEKSEGLLGRIGGNWYQEGVGDVSFYCRYLVVEPPFKTKSRDQKLRFTKSHIHKLQKKNLYVKEN